jgi:hypothetical protein
MLVVVHSGLRSELSTQMGIGASAKVQSCKLATNRGCRNQPAVFAGDAWLCPPHARPPAVFGGMAASVLPPNWGRFHLDTREGRLEHSKNGAKGRLSLYAARQTGLPQTDDPFCAKTTGSHTVIVATASVITANNKATDSKTPFSSTSNRDRGYDQRRNDVAEWNRTHDEGGAEQRDDDADDPLGRPAGMCQHG